jgi:hypothetical protein
MPMNIAFWRERRTTITSELSRSTVVSRKGDLMLHFRGLALTVLRPVLHIYTHGIGDEELDVTPALSKRCIDEHLS